MTVDTKPLGRTGVQVPEIGLGTWNYQGDPAVVHAALEQGSFLLDTAESYGTESQVGQAIADNRDAYFVATKVSASHFRRADLLKSADASLGKLGIDTIDLYQLHSPSATIPIAETMAAMDELVGAGKVRHVGVSNFSVDEMQAAENALQSGSVVENQIKFSMWDHGFADTVIPYCEENGVTVLAYSSLEQGRFEAELKSKPKLAEVMARVCVETGKTPAQVIMNWVLRSPVVITIPQTNRAERVPENAGAAGWRLTDEQHSDLAAAAGNHGARYWWR